MFVYVSLESKKAEKEAKVIEEKVNVVHQKIMDITGGKTKEAQKKLDEVTKQWEKTRSTITQLQVAIKTSERLVCRVCINELLCFVFHPFNIENFL